MQIARFHSNGRSRHGIVDSDNIIEAQSSPPPLTTGPFAPGSVVVAPPIRRRPVCYNGQRPVHQPLPPKTTQEKPLCPPSSTASQRKPRP